MSTSKTLTLAFVAAFAGAAGAWVFLSGSDEGPGSAPAAVTSAPQDDGYIGARTRGSPDAPVTIYEVSDFQCPFCKMFVDSTLPALEAEYIETGKVQIVFVNFPLDGHPNARAAHEFAMCAAKQDRFWPVHDLLFRHQEVWEKLAEPGDYFRQLGDSAGLVATDLDACFDSGEVRSIIEDEVQSVFRSGIINSTPSFMIEGGLLRGAQPIEVFRPILDSLVEAKSSR